MRFRVAISDINRHFQRSHLSRHGEVFKKSDVIAGGFYTKYLTEFVIHFYRNLSFPPFQKVENQGKIK
jgi:hypothetical protein